MIGIFGDYYGTSVNSQDMRALSQAEIQKAQLANWSAMQNYVEPPGAALGSLNAYRPHLTETRPLDERFADFKIRLAAAIERNRLGKTEGTN